MSCSGFTLLEEHAPGEQPSLPRGAVLQHLKRNEQEPGKTWAAWSEAVTWCHRCHQEENVCDQTKSLPCTSASRLCISEKIY